MLQNNAKNLFKQTLKSQFYPTIYYFHLVFLRLIINRMRYLLFVLLFCQSFYLSAQSSDYTSARNRITATLNKLKGDGRQKSYKFSQVNQDIAHLARPWMTDTTKLSGGFSIVPSKGELFIAESFASRSGKKYRAVNYYNYTSRQLKDTGTHASDISDEEREYYIYNTAIYTPMFVLQDFLNSQQSAFKRYKKGTVDTIVYENSAGKRIISIAINSLKNEIAAVSILYPHEMYGDVLKTISYSQYLPNVSGIYPTRVKESELGIVKNDMKISASPKLENLTTLRNIPFEEKPKVESGIGVKYMKFNESIHYLELQSADMRSIIVEFNDFLLVAGAPLNNANGTIIIEKIRQLFPSKPIRYFVAGHHHPHYLGGVRPFIANNVQVLAHSSNANYIKQLATFPHTLIPDELQQRPQSLVMDTFENEKVVTDGNLEMRIIHIGKMSAHTEDYLVYYFPKYNLLIEDDLAFLPQEGPARPASKREQGLYEAIKKYNMDVQVIIQSWPVNNYGVKTLFFEGDLAESVWKANVQKK